jgi:CheY-like chemotaxis protein
VTQTDTAKPARAYQILLVDDNTEFLEMFKEFLLRHKPGMWVVHTADNYAPALSLVKEHPIDLLVLDLKLPVMDGQQLLMLLKRTKPELQVVVLTGYATPEARDQCLQNGATLFFDKNEIIDGFEKIYIALESVASTPAQGFRGLVKQVGLTDVLQMECLGRKSSVLDVNSPAGSGRIYIEDGSIVHAVIGVVEGENALFKILGLTGGEFLLKPFSKPPRQSITGNWESLVMEAARLSDEASAEEAATVEPAEAPATVDRAIVEVALCSQAGELLYEWQSTGADQRIQLITQAYRSSAIISELILLGRADRVEAETETERVVILLHAGKRIFVRSANPGSETKPKPLPK